MKYTEAKKYFLSLLKKYNMEDKIGMHFTGEAFTLYNLSEGVVFPPGLMGDICNMVDEYNAENTPVAFILNPEISSMQKFEENQREWNEHCGFINKSHRR